jgi:hypothetical protein
MLYYDAKVVWNIRLKGDVFCLPRSIRIFPRFINAIDPPGWVEQLQNYSIYAEISCLFTRKHAVRYFSITLYVEVYFVLRCSAQLFRNREICDGLLRGFSNPICRPGMVR